MASKEKSFNKLFSEFPPISTQAWEEIISKDLKGADYRKKLIWKTNEGFEVKPYYRAEDLQGLEYLDNFPGNFPFVRGNKTNNNSWLIRQDIIVEDLENANKKALFILDRGIESLGFILPGSLSVEQMDELFKDIVIEAVEINFICENNHKSLLKTFVSFLKQKKANFAKINGSITFNPLTQLALKGKSSSILEAKQLLEITKELPNFRVIAIHGSIFHNSGSSSVEELGFALATATEYLDQLTNADVNIDEITPKIRFDFAVGGNYFMEIAKIRAARLLWAKIVEAYHPSCTSVAKMFVHSTTSNWNKTIYDPYVNMLRTTTEAMSSVIGGTDSLTINAFNESFENPTEFGERIARNQQLLLKEESYFDKVVDPSAGSYYIENLTDSIATEAWKIFLEVEEKGGFVKAMKFGHIQKTIKASAEKRDMDIANRKEIFLGTNQFPNFNEKIEKKMDEFLFVPTDCQVKDAEVESLKPYRGTQAFEALRYKTDVFSKKNKRPLVFMLTYGNLNMRKARATFASNFFACAGFEVQDNNGFISAEEGVEAAKAAKANIIVICSSDEEYAELAPAVKDLTKNEILVIAGYPKEIMEDLKAKGIENFIHVKSNVLETLNKFQVELGIK
jgi:methylmalonyl-CoA mutase